MSKLISTVDKKKKKMKLEIPYLGSHNYVIQDKAHHTKKANSFPMYHAYEICPKVLYGQQPS